MMFRLGELGIKCRAVHSVSAKSNGNAKVLRVRRALKRHHKTEILTDQRASLSGSKMSNASCRARVLMLYELQRMANKLIKSTESGCSKWCPPPMGIVVSYSLTQTPGTSA